MCAHAYIHTHIYTDVSIPNLLLTNTELIGDAQAVAWAAVAVPWNHGPGKQNSQDHEPQHGNEWLGCGTPGERPSGEKEHGGWQLFEGT